jgi:small-conductance mechanosensitive channel
LAVALALQDTLSNLFAGLQILASRQLRPGDYIKMGNGKEGYVRDISWRVTTVQAMSLETHVIPNAKLASDIVTNYHLPESVCGITVPVGVAYDSDLDRVEAVTLAVARETQTDVEGGVPEYEPVARYNSFGDSAITLNVTQRTTEFGNQYRLRHEFIKRLHRRYAQENIEIPFPQSDVHLRRVQG